MAEYHLQQYWDKKLRPWKHSAGGIGTQSSESADSACGQAATVVQQSSECNVAPGFDKLLSKILRSVATNGWELVRPDTANASDTLASCLSRCHAGLFRLRFPYKQSATLAVNKTKLVTYSAHETLQVSVSKTPSLQRNSSPSTRRSQPLSVEEFINARISFRDADVTAHLWKSSVLTTRYCHSYICTHLPNVYNNDGPQWEIYSLRLISPDQLVRLLNYLSSRLCRQAIVEAVDKILPPAYEINCEDVQKYGSLSMYKHYADAEDDAVSYILGGLAPVDLIHQHRRLPAKGRKRYKGWEYIEVVDNPAPSVPTVAPPIVPFKENDLVSNTRATRRAVREQRAGRATGGANSKGALTPTNLAARTNSQESAASSGGGSPKRRSPRDHASTRALDVVPECDESSVLYVSANGEHTFNEDYGYCDDDEEEGVVLDYSMKGRKRLLDL